MKLIEKMAEEYATNTCGALTGDARDYDNPYDYVCDAYVAGNLNLLKIAEEFVQRDPESAPICGCVRSLLEFLNNYCGKGRGE